jgi:hypothetical protein
MLPVVLASARSSRTLLNYVVSYGNITVRITSNGKFRPFVTRASLLAFRISASFISNCLTSFNCDCHFFLSNSNGGSLDVNAFKEFFESPTMLSYSIFYPTLSVACLGFAIYKQVIFIKFKGLQHSIAQTVLWLEIIGNARKCFLLSVILVH